MSRTCRCSLSNPFCCKDGRETDSPPEPGDRLHFTKGEWRTSQASQADLQLDCKLICQLGGLRVLAPSFLSAQSKPMKCVKRSISPSAKDCAGMFNTITNESSWLLDKSVVGCSEPGGCCCGGGLMRSASRGLTGPQLTSACQSGCLQIIVITFPS